MEVQSKQLYKPTFAAGTRKKSYKTMFKMFQQFLPFYLLFFPVFLYYIIFCYLPMGGVVIAFKEFNLMQGILGSEWVGFKNFTRFLSNGDFWVVFKNTLIISGLRTLFGFPTPIIFAIMLYELKFLRIKKFVQTVSYLPHFISWVVVSGMLFNLFSSTGVVTKLMVMAGGEATSLLSKEEYFRQFLVGTAIWKELGWNAIIYLAALAGVDKQLYEAAMIDGATARQQLWHITLPSIRNVISIMFVLSFANVLNAGFEQVLVMINPSVTDVAEIIDYHIYRIGLLQVNNYSYASAIGVFKAVLSLALVLITNWGARKIDEEGAIW